MGVYHPFIATLPPATPTVLQYYCTPIAYIYAPPPNLPLYSKRNTILMMAILRKGQSSGGSRRAKKRRSGRGCVCAIDGRLFEAVLTSKTTGEGEVAAPWGCPWVCLRYRQAALRGCAHIEDDRGRGSGRALGLSLGVFAQAGGLGAAHVQRTDSSSDSASHTHSARRPSATALLTRSRGGGLTPPPSHTRTLRHTLSYGIAMGVYSLSLSLSLSDARVKRRSGRGCVCAIDGRIFEAVLG